MAQIVSSFSVISPVCQEGLNSPIATQLFLVTLQLSPPGFSPCRPSAVHRREHQGHLLGGAPLSRTSTFSWDPGRKSIQNFAPHLFQQQIETASRSGLGPPLHSWPSLPQSSSRWWTGSVTEPLQLCHRVLTGAVRGLFMGEPK